MTLQQTARPPNSPNLEAIPSELRARRQWVNWRLEDRLDKKTGELKPTKVPYNARTGFGASDTNPKSWSTFAQSGAALVRRYGNHYDGIGYVFAPNDPYAGIDLDGCRDPASGRIATWAQAIIDRLRSYTEVSPSETGVKIVVRGALPNGKGRKKNLPDAEQISSKPPAVELYDRGRYFTITGLHLAGTPTIVKARRHTLDALCGELFPAKAKQTNEHTKQPARGTVDLDDARLWEIAFKASNGPSIRALFEGSTAAYNGDESSADLALCNHLAFYTHGDQTRMDRMFRQSGLYRDKWDRDDYRQWTLDKAVAGCSSYFGDNDDSPRLGGTLNGNGNGNGRPAAIPRTLAEVNSVFQRWLFLPNLGSVHVTLGAIAANYLPGDPTWLMLVGASGGGKTEVLNSAAHLPHVRLAATLTESALLSGTAKKERDAAARGGLLRELGAFGILAMKDFTSVLSMNRDTRAALLAALRECFDGSWTRHVGVDGGKTLAWEGKLGLIAGCTATIDGYHQVVSTMGERFLYFRLPEADPEELGGRALDNTGQELELRKQLAEAVEGLFAGLDLQNVKPPVLSAAERDRFIALGALAARARSAVERESGSGAGSHEVILIPDAEAPTRITQALRRLDAGLRAIGLSAEEAWPLVVKVGLDSMTKVRRIAFDYLVNLDPDAWAQAPALAAKVGQPTSTTRRALEDLALHGVVERTKGGEGVADQWRLSARTRDWAARVGLGTVSQMSVPLRSVNQPFTNGVGDTHTTITDAERTCSDIRETVPSSGPYKPWCDGCAQPAGGDRGPLREVSGYQLHDDCTLPVGSRP